MTFIRKFRFLTGKRLICSRWPRNPHQEGGGTTSKGLKKVHHVAADGEIIPRKGVCSYQKRGGGGRRASFPIGRNWSLRTGRRGIIIIRVKERKKCRISRRRRGSPLSSGGAHGSHNAGKIRPSLVHSPSRADATFREKGLQSRSVCREGRGIV